MADQPVWLYDEFCQVGKDYALQDEVDQYDARHADFRDIEAESRQVLDALGVGAGDLLIDFGSGTGTFALAASRRCERVHAVDVSRAMLDHARAKAARAKADNIAFFHDGFLTYAHQGRPADVITSTYVLHHLPDFWKGVALGRLAAMLRPGGRFYLHDVVMEEQGAMENIAALIDKLGAAGGAFLREDAEAHFREEFSTFDWIMDDLLRRAGFAIDRKEIADGLLATYYCTRLGA